MLVYLSAGAVALAAVMAAEAAVSPPLVSPALWRRLLWGVAFLVLFAVSALRFDTGTDYSSTEGYLGYVEIFRLYADGGEMRFGIDPSLLALIRLVSALGGDVQWFFAITSALVCGLSLRACRRLSCSPALSVALFLAAGLYLESFNIVRQWVAIACVLNAFAWVGWDAADGEAHPGCGGRSFVRYALWVAAAALAHPSAAFWLALWPLFAVPLNGRRAVVLAVVLVGAALVGWRVLAAVLEGTRYGRYFFDPTGLYTTPHLRPNAIVTTACTLALTVWCYRGRTGTWGRWASALTMVQVALLALLVSEAFLPYIVDRVARYLVPLVVLQVPWALAELGDLRAGDLWQGCRPFARDASLRQVLAVVVCALWLAASTVQFVGGKDDVLPYRNILTTPRDEVTRMFDTPPVVPEADRPLDETGE